ncbi:glutathione S-transferase family protein [Noviherbaspirillum malthae]|uniref:glutathione S-transferase family protein n=1 Tax=Noviherbaspirillum malthae TaxID=1260987 RepID=UPI00188FA596|nr:glutathione S-transferase family protein [Noviherbaspirillum malthae]
MLTLYHCVSARSFRPLWMLEELRLPYVLKMLPFPPRFAARDYLAVNPLGTVPALLDGDLRMTESAAICQYLAFRGGSGKPGTLDVAGDEPAYGEYLNWLHFGEASLTFPQTLVLRYGRFEPEQRRQPQVAEDYRRWFLARLRGIDAVVARQDYLCAQRFTAADVSVGYALMLGELIGLEPEFSEPVRAYWERLQAREGYQRALAAQEKAAIEQGVSPLPATVTGIQG